MKTSKLRVAVKEKLRHEQDEWRLATIRQLAEELLNESGIADIESFLDNGMFLSAEIYLVTAVDSFLQGQAISVSEASAFYHVLEVPPECSALARQEGRDVERIRIAMQAWKAKEDLWHYADCNNQFQ
jgi:hypothetical protein